MFRNLTPVVKPFMKWLLTPVAVFLAFAAVSVCVGRAGADTIELKDGRILEGKIVKETDTTVEIQLKLGKMTFKKDEIKRIEKKKDVRDTFENELEKLHPSNPAAYLKLGKEYIGKKDFVTEAILLLEIASILSKDLYAEANELIGDTCTSLGSGDEAVDYYLRALSARSTDSSLRKKLDAARGTDTDKNQLTSSLIQGLEKYLQGLTADAAVLISKGKQAPGAGSAKQYLGMTLDALIRSMRAIKTPTSPTSQVPAGTCKSCKGSGTLECVVCKAKGGKYCTRCSGKGSLTQTSPSGSKSIICTDCSGLGMLLCLACKSKAVFSYTYVGTSGTVTTVTTYEVEAANQGALRSKVGGWRSIYGCQVTGGRVRCKWCGGRGHTGGGETSDPTVVGDTQTVSATSVYQYIEFLRGSLAQSETVIDMCQMKMKKLGTFEVDQELAAGEQFVFHKGKWMALEEKRKLVPALKGLDDPAAAGIDVEDTRKTAVPLAEGEVNLDELLAKLNELESKRVSGATADVLVTQFSPASGDQGEGTRGPSFELIGESKGNINLSLCAKIMKHSETRVFLVPVGRREIVVPASIVAPDLLQKGTIKAYYSVKRTDRTIRVDENAVVTHTVEADLKFLEFSAGPDGKSVFWRPR
ncbi:MAG: hypothetical protein RDV41_01400 [Planctomycetota bacterium]|nr:hypothetical protein [Planctomycetota bacterium]